MGTALEILSALAAFPRASIEGQSDLTSWKEANTRRVALIQKNVAHVISSGEQRELERLQAQADEQIRNFAPLPLRQLEDLKATLKHRGILVSD